MIVNKKNLTEQDLREEARLEGLIMYQVLGLGLNKKKDNTQSTTKQKTINNK